MDKEINLSHLKSKEADKRLLHHFKECLKNRDNGAMLIMAFRKDKGYRIQTFSSGFSFPEQLQMLKDSTESFLKTWEEDD